MAEDDRPSDAEATQHAALALNSLVEVGDLDGPLVDSGVAAVLDALEQRPDQGRPTPEMGDEPVPSV